MQQTDHCYICFRAAIEERYSADLSRLSKRTFNDKIDPDYIGTLGTLWGEILHATSVVANARSNLAKEILKLEYTFRTRCDKDQDAEWSKVKQSLSALSANYESDFVKLTKDYADKIVKVEKYDAKSKKKATSQGKLNAKKFEQMDRERIELIKKNLSLFAQQEEMIAETLAGVNGILIVACDDYSVENEIQNFCATKGTMFVDVQTSRVASASHSELRQSDQTVSVASGINNVVEPTPPVPVVDENGFSIRPETVDLFASNFPNGSEADDFHDESASRIQPKIHVAIQEHVIKENISDTQSAIANLTSKLQAPGSATGGSIRGRIQSSYDSNAAVSRSHSTAAPPAPHEATPAKADVIVCETLNILQVNGMVDKILITGEISIQLLDPLLQLNNDSKFCKILIRNFDSLLQIVPNEEYVSLSSSIGNEYDLNLEKLAEQVHSNVQLFKYQVWTESPEQFSPIIVKPIWKCEEKQASLLINYEFNSDLLKRLPPQELTIMASIQDGGEIGAVQTKPAGVWDLDLRCIFWQLSDPEWEAVHGDYAQQADASTEEIPRQYKILARVETSKQCLPDPVAIKYSSSMGLFSLVDVEFSGLVGHRDGTGSPHSHQPPLVVSVHKSVCSGKFGSQIITVLPE
ncbi:hypothetical protein BATDEDRAFT_90049 [Batrachochytrium dendrobatidis JAM81]|uniref:MHD domain-containing protein n=1 Tax=Batrachochytrium dendrobatidis (strain JAM81 / FGSC 10211) TaxID=684364 RepID=F4P6T8_BATDJ|nr:uncharacterized protein BATDEDRAFT_90049 [Batrachochytrium dendrobatidis JAM81]EGF79066.1 hypothetical protein BATDEDRAFT_90049 [Batrachochytrium dendrobatidis JAM81]|eukprot:XP_006680562.1 hypothetical protein BATDEDRAFT_90049 [Batrachochytrium dendrobatidis JAM81]